MFKNNNDFNDVVSVSLYLTLNIFYTLLHPFFKQVIVHNAGQWQKGKIVIYYVRNMCKKYGIYINLRALKKQCPYTKVFRVKVSPGTKVLDKISNPSLLSVSRYI